jgi:hypothetical protein
MTPVKVQGQGVDIDGVHPYPGFWAICSDSFGGKVDFHEWRWAVADSFIANRLNRKLKGEIS